MHFSEIPQFKREFKKHKKKYPSLDQDLDKLKKALIKFPGGNESKHWKKLTERKNVSILKVRLACAYLKKKSFRVIYAHHKKTQTLELIEFVEIYFKGNKKGREDKKRIDEYLKTL